MLQLKNIHKTFNLGTINEKVALNGVDLVLNEGDFVTVIGGNGAGKSTMLNAIAGVWPIDEGSILIDGVDVTGLPEHKRAQYLGRVFQDPMTGTAADMQIEENLALAARRGKRRTLRTGITAKERKEYKELLKILGLGLEERLTAKVGLLSGGQRQRVLISRALASEPELLLLDEPTANIDPGAEEQFYQTLEVLRNRMTVLTVSHDLGFVSREIDHIICVNRKVSIHRSEEFTSEAADAVYHHKVNMIRHDHSCFCHCQDGGEK